jgi:hypothetical protein
MTPHLCHLSRRSFNAFLLGAATWPYNVVDVQLKPLDYAKSLQDALVGLFKNPERAYGLACLNALPPHESSPQQLRNAIFGIAAWGSERMKSKQEIRERIAGRVHQDFPEDVVINVQGWILSQVEARLYALVALSLKAANEGPDNITSPLLL